MAERGTPDLISSQAPFIQALVQKSVTVITNLAGRLTHWMLSESCAASQGAEGKNLAPRLRIGRDAWFAANIALPRTQKSEESAIRLNVSNEQQIPRRS